MLSQSLRYQSNYLSILLGNGDGTFQPGASYQSATVSIAVGDFNGDGKPDLVASASGTSPARD